MTINKVIKLISIILISILIIIIKRPQIYESFIGNIIPIPGITFIVLEKYQNRINNVKQLINNQHLTNYHIFKAIDGTKLNRLRLLKEGFITEYVKSNVKPGVIGCSLSHLNIWLNFVTSHQNNLIVLEDDIDLTNNFKVKIALLLNNLPEDYDICYLQLRDNLDPSFKRKTINKYLRNGSPQYGTVGYIISRKGANKLIPYCFPIYNAIDIMISDAVKKRRITSYITTNDIVFHEYKFTSVVCGKGKHCTPEL